MSPLRFEGIVTGRSCAGRSVSAGPRRRRWRRGRTRQPSACPAAREFRRASTASEVDVSATPTEEDSGVALTGSFAAGGGAAGKGVVTAGAGAAARGGSGGGDATVRGAAGGAGTDDGTVTSRLPAAEMSACRLLDTVRWQGRRRLERTIAENQHGNAHHHQQQDATPYDGDGMGGEQRGQGAACRLFAIFLVIDARWRRGRGLAGTTSFVTRCKLRGEGRKLVAAVDRRPLRRRFHIAQFSRPWGQINRHPTPQRM